ncbi:MAG: phosphoribosyltransferase family protein [Bacteroidota bacterium]|nr:phosphoribosyltransferase family protein [Bacteroidota bacterium]
MLFSVFERDGKGNTKSENPKLISKLSVEKQIILSNEQCIQKIRRIAFEIYENNVSENKLVFAGIFDKGYILSQLIAAEYEKIAKNKPSIVKITLDKFSPTQSEIALDHPLDLLQNKSIVIVDDVLNSGRTLAYSIKPFLTIPVKKIEVAVLVDRGHKSFPIAADYVGYSLSTTLKEHIDVVFEQNDINVFLK